MAGQTTYYQLETYESNDVPDLRDQYNSSMYKIDGALNTIANVATNAYNGVATAVANSQTALDNAAAAVNTANAANTAAATAQSAAETASSQASTAATAASNASTAAANASAGVTALNTRVTALEAGNVIKYDQGYEDISIDATSYATADVTFATDFTTGTANPMIDLCVSGGTTAPNGIFLSTKSESKTGFTINVYNANAASKSIRVRWGALQVQA